MMFSCASLAFSSTTLAAENKFQEPKTFSLYQINARTQLVYLALIQISRLTSKSSML